jgi:hypothetical protein
MILRRLAARHRGRFPRPALVRIWREMLAATTQLQGPFTVAVYAPDGRRGLWDLARDHYGSFTPLVAVNSPAAGLRAVVDGVATVAVVALPQENADDPWWRALMGEEGKVPRIVARLPFCGRGNGRSDADDALVLGQLTPEPTGDDRSVLGVELSTDVSRGRLKEVLEAGGLKPVGFHCWLGGGPGGRSLHVVEIDGLVGADDPRLASIAETLGEAPPRVAAIGSYATPLAPSGQASKG